MIKNILLLLLTILSVNIYTEEIHRYSGDLIHRFEVGKKDGQLGLLTGDAAWGTSETKPGKFFLNSYNQFIISDVINGRIIYYDYSFNVVQILKDEIGIRFSGRMKDTEYILFGTFSNSRFYALNKINNNSIELLIPTNISAIKYKTVFTDNIIFSYLKDGTLTSFILEDRENLNFSKRLSEKDTIKLFKKKKKYGLTDYELDDKKRIFYKGELINTDFETLYSYWDEMHKLKKEKQPRTVPGVPSFEKLKGASSPLIGKDIDGNAYFSSGKGCIIYDKSGWVLDYFRFSKNTFVTPTINPNGDVFYLLKEGTKETPMLNIYRIDRRW